MSELKDFETKLIFNQLADDFYRLTKKDLYKELRLKDNQKINKDVIIMAVIFIKREFGDVKK